jgi:hypothetical protein
MSEYSRVHRRYIVEPGWVISKTDGQEHFIGADQLIRLYGVDRRDCIIINSDEDYKTHRLDLNDVRLQPRHSGDYTLPLDLRNPTPPAPSRGRKKR